MEEYRTFAKQFTASEYDPEAWADLIKESGARYTVITAKHHDGFALYDSAVSEWDNAGICPAPDDLLTPLATAIRARGLKFGLYYSHAQDWNHPGGSIWGVTLGEPGWDPAQKGDFDTCLRNIAVPQTREILTRFQPDILWWDTAVNMTKERGQPFHDLLALQPDIITNDRLALGFPGYTKTPEQIIPPHGYPGQMFEVCMTLNRSWGYKSYDHEWKSSRSIIQNLSDISSKGGNFLINIGPDALGRIPEPSVKILKDLGRWMKINSEAIYATEAGPFPRRLPWGRVTQKISGTTTSLFLHVWDWPSDGQLLLPTIKQVPAQAILLANGVSIPSKITPEGLLLQLPTDAPDADVSVLRLDFLKPVSIAMEPFITPDADGCVNFRAHDASTYGGHEGNFLISGSGTEAFITGWKSANWRLEYLFKAPKAQKWNITAELASTDPVKLILAANGQIESTVDIPATGPGVTWKTISLGSLAFSAGQNHLKLKGNPENWKELNVRNIWLVPSPPD